MLRDQVINFLEAAVVLLILTNVLSVAAATYALALAHRMSRFAPRAAAQPFLAPFQRWPQLGKLMQRGNGGDNDPPLVRLQRSAR